jgi:hypothetical protein
VVDIGSKEIIQFNRSGIHVNTISKVNGKNLEGPARYIADDINDRDWMIDRNEILDRIYTKPQQSDMFTYADSLSKPGRLEGASRSDLVTNPFNDLAWTILLNNQSSSVLQLSADGTRHWELTGFYNPYDLEINPYDGTLLVVDTGNSRVVHYDKSHNILGTAETLNFPIKVLIE